MIGGLGQVGAAPAAAIDVGQLLADDFAGHVASAVRAGEMDVGHIQIPVLLLNRTDQSHRLTLEISRVVVLVDPADHHRSAVGMPAMPAERSRCRRGRSTGDNADELAVVQRDLNRLVETQRPGLGLALFGNGPGACVRLFGRAASVLIVGWLCQALRTRRGRSVADFERDFEPGTWRAGLVCG